MRYFIVCYLHKTKNGFGSGDTTFATLGGYLNNAETIRAIKKLNPEMESIVLTNIIELTEADYKDYTR